MQLYIIHLVGGKDWLGGVLLVDAVIDKHLKAQRLKLLKNRGNGLLQKGLKMSDIISLLL